MNDLERLRDWMREKEMSVWQLAREMGTPRHTVYFAVVRREKLSDHFVKTFIRRYGMDEGVKIFQEYFASMGVVA